MTNLKKGVSKMRTNPIPQWDFGLAVKLLKKRSLGMNSEGLQVSERIDEMTMMCGRKNPVYEQISSFSIALYTIGFFDCPDLLSFDDVDARDAAVILKEEFEPVHQENLPPEYRITESRERYLLVAGDPLFPIHFAVLTDMRSPRPYFSKLPFFGCGFDSLGELVSEFAGIDGVDPNDFHYFRKKWEMKIPASSMGKIYIIK
jgi:hypothetical protein